MRLREQPCHGLTSECILRPPPSAPAGRGGGPAPRPARGPPGAACPWRPRTQAVPAPRDGPPRGRAGRRTQALQDQREQRTRERRALLAGRRAGLRRALGRRRGGARRRRRALGAGRQADDLRQRGKQLLGAEMLGLRAWAARGLVGGAGVSIGVTSRWRLSAAGAPAGLVCDHVRTCRLWHNRTQPRHATAL